VPADHQLRKIDAVLDLSGLRLQLAPFYSHTGRPSVIHTYRYHATMDSSNGLS
jgi:hypothetical protein